MTERYELILFADYHQIHVADAGHETDAGTLWTEAAVIAMYAVGADMVAIRTARNMETTVFVETHAARPAVETEGWDQIVELSIATPSLRVLIMGCSDGPDAFGVDVPTDRTTVRVSWGGLDRVSEGALEGDDRYVVQVWPSEPHDVIRIK